MNLTWKNDEKPNFLSDLGPFDPNFGSCGVYLYQMLDIVTSYDHIQFQRKLMIQTQGNGEKTSFWGLI